MRARARLPALPVTQLPLRKRHRLRPTTGEDFEEESDVVSIRKMQHPRLWGPDGVGPVQVRGRARRARTGHSWGSIDDR